MKTLYFLLSYLVIFSFFFNAAKASVTEQSDTVKAPNVATAPTIDGVGDDAAWQGLQWQAIDKVWIPFDNVLDSTDFYGRYKVVWSETNNLLYMLVEINDEYFDFGYVPLASGYPDWDCIEIFVDEDRSGGLHLIDGPGTDVWGIARSNGENAFSYHMLPNEDVSTLGSSNVVNAIDLTGGPTDNPTAINYQSHFPEFTVAKANTTYTWEFSLKIYDDTYDNATPSNSRVTLAVNKIMGLSVAYNDDDTPADGRDNMIGSVVLSSAQSNDSWFNADVFGVLKLVNTVSNAAPTVANPIVDVNLTNKDAVTASNDLKTVFNDSDGDNLSFSASSNNTHLTVTISSGDMLIIQSDGNLGGTATVTVIANDGLLSVSDYFDVTEPVGVNINPLTSFKNSINIYPQPAKDFATLSINNNIKSDVTLSIIDITGKDVINLSYQKEDNIFEQKINLSKLSQGIYFININQADMKEVRRIIKY